MHQINKRFRRLIRVTPCIFVCKEQEALMKNLYPYILIAVAIQFSLPASSQNCSSLQATFQSFESRCASTGAIKIHVTGGTGLYKYKVTGPVNINFTSSDSITGLSSGTYTVEIQDINSGCKLSRPGVQVPGDYSDPRFILTAENVSCDNGFNGTIKVENIENGRPPFNFSIVAPSASGVGTTNTTGIFEGLTAGDYSIRLTDSCGGIQTRTISVENYTWRIDAHQFAKTSCYEASGWIRVIDSRGHVSTIDGIDGMQYGILVEGADTIWSSNPNFIFQTPSGTTSVEIFARDACGNTKSVTASTFLYPSIAANIGITNRGCSTFTASVSGKRNFFSPQFCLFDNDGNQIDCNSSGVFANLPYGTYCIKATDACADTVITRCFTAAPLVPSAGNTVISNKQCATFDVALSGQRNLFDPQYCLFDENDVLIGCNTTGIFTALAYGAYCIRTTDACSGRVFDNCFQVGQPEPTLPAVIIPSYVTCEVFGLVVNGDSIYNPIYCLRDDLGAIIECNTTGQFDSIPLGSYCVTVYDECRDTTLERCMTVGPPTAINDMTVSTRNETCSTFVATVATSRLAGKEFFLYNSDDELVTSNTTGIFAGLPYGDYCVKAKPDCPDTTLVTCFTAPTPVPAIGGVLRASDRTCSTFTGQVTGQTNLTAPTYYLTNTGGDILATNTTGIFPGLAYGSYCILIQDNCFDTTLSVCGTVPPPVFRMSAIASHSCNYGLSKLNLSANTYPATIMIYNPSDVLIHSSVINGPVVVDDIPELPEGQHYRVIAQDACSGSDEAHVAPVTAWFRSSGNVTQRCPGGSWANGSGNISATAKTNTGNLTVRIIKKDDMALTPALAPNVVTGDSTFTFQNLGPATYIVRYTTTDACRNNYYDTITVMPYDYPNLSRSSAYQCDANGFSVGAVVTHGVGPFQYEIIGSTPDEPSIIAGPQSSPIFNVDNGHNYSLIRLRVLDACGNASLGDASILPLANSGIKVTENCLGSASTLSVDTIYNGTVNWYYKATIDAEDSTALGGGFKLVIDPLTASSLGYYIAKMELNNGCINRLYQFHLNGDCHPIVPVINVEFTGRYADGASHLNWSIRNDLGLQEITVERKNGASFDSLGTVKASAFNSPGQYSFIDRQPMAENFYRLKFSFEAGKPIYSKIIHLNAPGKNTLQVYPNPATDYINLVLPKTAKQGWKLEVINSVNQVTMVSQTVSTLTYQIKRTSNMAAGLYILKATNLSTGEVTFERILFGSRTH